MRGLTNLQNFKSYGPPRDKKGKGKKDGVAQSERSKDGQDKNSMRRLPVR